MDFKPWGLSESKIAISAASKYLKNISKKDRNDQDRFNVMEKALKEKGFLRSVQEIKVFYEGIITIQRRKSFDVKSNPSLKHTILENINEDNSKGKDTEKSRVEISLSSTEELLSNENKLFCGGNGIATECQTDQKIVVNENNPSPVHEEIDCSNKIQTNKKTEHMLKDMQTTTLRLNQDSVTKSTKKSCMLKNQNQQYIDNETNVSSLINTIGNVQNVNGNTLLKQNNQVGDGFGCLESVVQNVMIDARKLSPTKVANVNCTNIATIQDIQNEPNCKNTLGVAIINNDNSVLQNKSQILDKIKVSKKRKKTSVGSKTQTVYEQDLKSNCENRISAEYNSYALMKEKEENISTGSYITDQIDLKDFNSSTNLPRVSDIRLDNIITTNVNTDSHKLSHYHKISRAGKDHIQVETQTTSKKETYLLSMNLVNCAEKKGTRSVNSVMSYGHNVFDEVISNRINTQETLITETPVHETKTHEIEAIVNSKSDSLVRSQKKRKSTSEAVPSRKNPKQKVLEVTQNSCEGVGENNNKLYSQPTTHQMVNDDNDHNKPEVKKNIKSIDNCRRTRSNCIDVEIPTHAVPTCIRPSATTPTNAKEQDIIAGKNKIKSGDLKKTMVKTTPNESNDSEMKSLVKSTIQEMSDVENEICDIRVTKTKKEREASNNLLIENINTKKLKPFNAEKNETEFKNAFEKEIHRPTKIRSGSNDTERIIQEVMYEIPAVTRNQDTKLHEIPIDTKTESLSIVETTKIEEVLLDNMRTEAVIDTHNENIKAIKIETSKALLENEEVDKLTDQNISQPIKKRGRKPKNSMTIILKQESKIPCRRSKRKSIDLEKPIQHELSSSSTTTLKDTNNIDTKDVFNGAENESKIKFIMSDKNDNSFEQQAFTSTSPNKKIVQETKLLTNTLNDSKIKKKSKSNAYNDGITPRESSGKLGINSSKEPNKPFNIIQDNSDVCMTKDSSTTVISKLDTIIEMNEPRLRSTNSQIKTQFAKRGNRIRASSKDVVYMFRNPSPPHFPSTILSYSQTESRTRVDLDDRPDNISPSNMNGTHCSVDSPGEQLYRLDSDVRRWNKLKRLKSGIKCVPKMIKNLTDQLKQTQRQIKKETKKQHLQQEKHLLEIRREHEQLQTWFVEMLNQVGHPPSKSETKD